MENGHMSGLRQKSSRSAVGDNFNFFSIFRKWRKSSYCHSMTTKIYKFAHLDGKCAHEWIEPKKFPVRGGRKLQFFRFFENEENPHILTPEQLKYTNSLIWMENGHMSKLRQKSSPAPLSAKTSIFSIFWKVFENEENPHILTPGQLKYTNSLIWMENGYMSELSHKTFPRSAVAENFNFFDFLKSFRKWRKSSYSHHRMTKIYKLTHLDGKWVHEWIEQKKFPRSEVGENFNFFDFLKSSRKWRKSSYSHSKTTKIYKFTDLDGKWAHEWIEPKTFPSSTGGVGGDFNFFTIFKEFSKMKKILIFSLQDNWNIQIHSFGWKMGTWVDWDKKVPGPRWAITSIFFRFFENEENPHIVTPWQLKYTNSLIWMENVHMSGLSQKSSRSAVGENFNFFDFSKMKKILIFSLQNN